MRYFMTGWPDLVTLRMSWVCLLRSCCLWAMLRRCSAAAFSASSLAAPSAACSRPHISRDDLALLSVTPLNSCWPQTYDLRHSFLIARQRDDLRQGFLIARQRDDLRQVRVGALVQLTAVPQGQPSQPGLAQA